MNTLTRKDKKMIKTSLDTLKGFMTAEGYEDFGLNSFHKCTYQIKDDIDNGLYGVGDNYEIWVYVIGFSFGEIVINDIGGRWVKDGNIYMVELDNVPMRMYPLSMAHNFLKWGEVDDLLFKYQFAQAVNHNKNNGLAD